jgi:hypothetical protein
MVSMRPAWVQRLRPAIPHDGEEPKSAADLAVETGLTHGQVGQAVVDIRDESPTEPLVSSNAGYIFTQVDWRVTKFTLWRVRTCRTIMRRLLTGVLLPYWNLQGLSEVQIRVRSRALVNAMQALDDEIEVAQAALAA